MSEAKCGVAESNGNTRPGFRFAHPGYGQCNSLPQQPPSDQDDSPPQQAAERPAHDRPADRAAHRAANRFADISRDLAGDLVGDAAGHVAGDGLRGREPLAAFVLGAEDASEYMANAAE